MCKICGCKHLGTINAAGATYYYCGNCEFISIDDKYIPLPGQAKERYLSHNNSTENIGYVRMFEEFISKCISPYSSIQTILDFGSGPKPVLAEILKEKGYRTDFYDIYFAPRKDYTNKTYDAITLTEVIEHLENPLQTLLELKNSLSKNGIMALMTMFHPKDNRAFRDWWYRKDFTHVSFFSDNTVKELADILDMKLLYTDNKNTFVLGNNLGLPRG